MEFDMDFRRILGTILILLGVAAILTSVYIDKEVEKGRGQISSAQNQVDQGKKVMGLVPNSKPIGNIITGSAQGKIDAGKRDVAKYEKISNQLFYVGIALVVIGFILVIIRKKRS